MQNFGVINKEHYGMLWYFWSGQLTPITRTVFRFPSELPRLYGISIGRTQKKNENIINDLYGTF